VLRAVGGVVCWGVCEVSGCGQKSLKGVLCVRVLCGEESGFVHVLKPMFECFCVAGLQCCCFGAG